MQAEIQPSMTDSDVLQKDQDRHLRSVSQEDIGSLAMELLREALPAISGEQDQLTVTQSQLGLFH